jgi:hypothetical protein
MGEVQSKLGDSNAVTGLSYLEDGQFAKIYKVLNFCYAIVCQILQSTKKDTVSNYLQSTRMSLKAQFLLNYTRYFQLLQKGLCCHITYRLRRPHIVFSFGLIYLKGLSHWKKRARPFLQEFCFCIC